MIHSDFTTDTRLEYIDAFVLPDGTVEMKWYASHVDSQGCYGLGDTRTGALDDLAFCLRDIRTIGNP